MGHTTDFTPEFEKTMQHIVADYNKERQRIADEIASINLGHGMDNIAKGFKRWGELNNEALSRTIALNDTLLELATDLQDDNAIKWVQKTWDDAVAKACER